VIEFNEVYNSYHAGIDVWCNADTTTAADNNKVRYNYIYTTSDHTQGYATTLPMHGILVSSNNASIKINDTEVYYNRIVNMSINGGIVVRASHATKILNNTCWGVFSGDTTGGGINIDESTEVLDNDGVIIKNNISDGASGGACLYVDAKTSISECENNLWYSPGNTYVFLLGIASYHSDDQAAYKTETGWDDTGLWEDPLLISTTDFRLQPGSPCIEAGVDVGLTTDILGNLITGLPEIGAYEYGYNFDLECPYPGYVEII
jgi:hypothetical protein